MTELLKGTPFCTDGGIGGASVEKPPSGVGLLLVAGAAQRRNVRTARRAAAAEDGLGGGVLGLAALKRFAIDGPPEFDPVPASLKGKTVVITGGNTGLGKESALRLAKAGATVVLTARSEEKGRKALADVKAASGNEDVHFLQLDLADLENVKSFKQRFTKEPYGGKIDVLMNNAGVMAIPERKDQLDQLHACKMSYFLPTNFPCESES
ncbi:Dhrs13 [Symbiodinium necroappetens]|uniref:Dhrs13 protein n=1 Tax=Symbiodinium necroappetens TaxID=1628268 RepID=A0A812S4M3_9DINO|nr:Dhrs13 [Symbiodinium necroappetens]